MVVLGRDVFEQAESEGKRATERVKQRLAAMLKSCGVTDVSDDMGKASLGTLSPALATLVECVDALQARIAELEKRGK